MASSFETKPSRYHKPQPPATTGGSALFLNYIFFSGQQRGACYTVFVAGPYQRHSLGTAAGFADLVDAEANELCLLGNDHDLAVLFDRERRDDLACLFGCLHVDDADAAAFCKTVAVDLRLLAKALLGD